MAGTPCSSAMHYGEIQYKVLLPIDTLESKEVIVSPTNNIAVTSVESCGCTGVLQYNNPITNVWQAETNITRQHALILGKDNSLRYEISRAHYLLNMAGEMCRSSQLNQL